MTTPTLWAFVQKYRAANDKFEDWLDNQSHDTTRLAVLTERLKIRNDKFEAKKETK